MHSHNAFDHNNQERNSDCWQSLLTAPSSANWCPHPQYNQNGNISQAPMQPVMQYMIAGPQQGTMWPHPSLSFTKGGMYCNTSSCEYVANMMLPPLQSHFVFASMILPPWQPTASWHTNIHVDGHLLPSAGFVSADECTGDVPMSLSPGSAAPHHGGTSDEPPCADERFTLYPSRVISGIDKRTTLIVRNIPTKMTQPHLKALISDRFFGKFDFLYVPCDWRTGGAFGYAFINLEQAADVLPFYQRFHHFVLPRSNSTKIWTVAYARLQGKIQLEAHFASRTSNQKIAPYFGVTCRHPQASPTENLVSASGLLNDASTRGASRRRRHAGSEVQKLQIGNGEEKPDLTSEPRQSRRMRRARAQARLNQDAES